MKEEEKFNVETAKSKSPQIAQDREFQELIQTKRINYITDNFDSATDEISNIGH